MSVIEWKIRNDVVLSRLAVAIILASSPAMAASDNDANKIDALRAQVHKLAHSARSETRSKCRARRQRKATQLGYSISLKTAPNLLDGRRRFQLCPPQPRPVRYCLLQPEPCTSRFRPQQRFNFRRAPFRFDGTAFKDWSYEFIYDFGDRAPRAGRSTAPTFRLRLGPLHLRLGASPVPKASKTRRQHLIYCF